MPLFGADRPQLAGKSIVHYLQKVDADASGILTGLLANFS